MSTQSSLSMSTMSITTTELLEVICELSAIQEMRVTVKMTTECTLIAACSIFVGGLVAGPIGILVGGVFGTGVGYNYSRGRFKSVPRVLAEDATPEQRERLARAILSLLNARNILVVAELSQALQTNGALVQTVLATVRNFFKDSMNYYVEN